jgi:hypothetical protein
LSCLKALLGPFCTSKSGWHETHRCKQISSIKTSPGFKRCPHFTRSSTTACTTRGRVSPHSRTRLLPSIQLSERLRPCSPLPLTHASPPRRPLNPSVAHLHPCLLTRTHSPPAYGRRASCPCRLLRWRRPRSLRAPSPPPSSPPPEDFRQKGKVFVGNLLLWARKPDIA